VLDDSYNANADSMVAALETLAQFPCTGQRWAVLGDMAEQGRHTEEAHEEVGRRAGELHLNRLVAIGQWAESTAVAAQAAGLEQVHVFGGVDSTLEVLPRWLRPGDVVLVKGSRVSGLERLVAALQSHLQAGKAG
jgi:UDP-N-acetylmuramoyl-tripeptide--D-alanyl-D-alanine ligase